MTQLDGLRTGFAWWLPILLAAIAAAIAVLFSQASASAWDADVHLWAREGRTPAEYAALVLDPHVQEAATTGMMSTEEGLPVLDDVSVELTDTLIRITVRSPRAPDAETLAISLARAAVDEAHIRYGAEAGLDVLGLVRPGARRVSPDTEWTAAWASAIGLGAGLAIAWITAVRSPGASTILGRLGRIGLKPIAVISVEAEREAGRSAPSTPGETAATLKRGETVAATLERGSSGDDAVMLANAINPVEGVIALVPLNQVSGVNATLVQTARTLAARGKPVLWLDARRPAFELSWTSPPEWLSGADWSPVSRSALINRAAARTKRPGCYLLLPTDPLTEAGTIEIAKSSAGVILMAHSDATDAELIDAQRGLRAARLLGVALTQAQSLDLQDFELAQMTE